ncbi:MAG: M1 family metallopeptidase [Clostridia bacterium]|nr:M1 family metallopeptidase [Clostridia bacterium]
MKKFAVFFAAALAAASLAPLTACHESVTATGYDIDVTYNEEEGTLSGTTAVTYYNSTGTTLTEIKFNLYGNAYWEGALYKPVSETYRTKAYYGGTSYGGMTVNSVDGCTEWSVCGEDENILVVTLKSGLEAGGSTTVTIDYTLALAKVNHRTGICENSVNLGNFYPIVCAFEDGEFVECIYYSDGDPFLSECADYTVTIDMPAGYECASSGSIVTDKTSGDRRICSYQLDNARDFAMVLSDKFTTLTQTVSGVQVTYYYYDDDDPQTKLNAACESLEYFADSFGQYVYPTLAVVQTGFAIGGMEYPALTMIGDTITGDDACLTIVHENAHQWWYAMVGSDQINNAWQDEGLAEYCTALFFEQSSGYSITLTGLVNSATDSYRAYYTVYNQIFGDADTTMSRSLSQFVSEYEYVNIAYNKAMIMFNTLRKSIGDDRFFEGLKNYYESCIYKIAAPEDLFASFVNTGVDLDSFFDSFINGKIVI